MAPNDPAAGPIAGIVLAAGLSTRAAPVNKLLADRGGRPIVTCVAETAVAAGLEPVIVVTGHQAKDVAAAVADSGAVTIHNPDYAQGMGGSIACGVRAVPEGAAGAVILLGDMPDVEAGTIRALFQAFDPDAGAAICVPVAQGRRGNPVLFGVRFFDALQSIPGDHGGKGIVEANADAVAEVPVDDPGVLTDYDNGA